MQKENSTESLREKEQTFLHRFLPDNVKSAHTVLFDPDGNVDLIPSTDELHSCLEAYISLIQIAAQHGCEAVRGCIWASELTLGYLARAVHADVPIPSFPRKQYLIQMIEDVLLEASKIHRNPLLLDGYKRIDAISRLLKQDL